MIKATFTLILASVIAGAPLPLIGQAAQKPISQMPASARQLIAIKVSGSKRFPEEAIAAASGLQMGAPVKDDEFKKAARRLGDTGVFTDIGYSFSYSAAGTKIEFKVTDAVKFVPVRFEDFVWFTDAEIRRRIKDHSPLFDGELPLSGKLAEEVSDVLQAMLVERSIPGHVDFTRSGKQDAPVDSIVYKVSDVLVQVRNIEFAGASEAELPALKSASQRLTDHEYSRTLLNALVQRQLLPIFYSRGYLKAAFGDPESKIVKEPSAKSEDGPRNLTIVDVTFPVTPGIQYKIKSMEWSGNQQFPADVLQKMVRSKPGEVANMTRIRDNLQDVQKIYASKGFVTASLKADADYDDAAATIVIRFIVTEGFEYHMGELEFRGLDNSLTAKLRNAWKIRQGDVYDASYLDEYLPVAHKLLPPSLDWEVASHVTANVHDKTVDVDLIYSVKAPK